MPQLALLLGCAFIWWLFHQDKRLRRLPSPALWIPGLWLAIASSRQVSFWLNVAGGRADESSNLEESPTNVDFNGILFLLAAVVLKRRRFSCRQFASTNKAQKVIYVYFICS